MDWTGGARRRFATGKKNSVLQKQKAHFAKMRAAATNTEKSQNDPDVAIAPRGSQLHGKHHSQPSQAPASYSDHNPFEKDSKRKTRMRGERTERVNIPSPLHISSAHPTSSARSLDSHVLKQLASGLPIAPHTLVAHGEGEEEALLVANRRRLLARSDWLCLNVKRPLHMAFGSARDNDFIGKRRKIRKSAATRNKKAERLLSPYTISGLAGIRGYAPESALHPAEVQVKIGTDALRSPTQRSLDSSLLHRGSRRSSTESPSLSEEPMLLGTDRDTHHSTLCPDRRSHSTEPVSADVSPAVSDMQSMQNVAEPPAVSRNQEGSIVDDDGYDEYDEYWKRILDIKPRRRSYDSLEAIKSSSLQMTTSDTGMNLPISLEVANSRPIQVGSDNDMVASTAAVAGTQMPDHDVRSAPTDKPGEREVDVWLLSTRPEPSERRPDELLDGTLRSAVKEDDEALWRRYIFGDYGSLGEPFSDQNDD